MCIKIAKTPTVTWWNIHSCAADQPSRRQSNHLHSVSDSASTTAHNL